MAFEQEQRAALRIIESIEEGQLGTAAAADLVEGADPALVYLLVTWLRKRYVGHDNADAVLGRLLEISKRPAIAAKMKEGQADPVVTWFEESYAYRDLGAKELVALVVDKLES
jgi:hypothetical protein